jgi:threonine dehydratase
VSINAGFGIAEVRAAAARIRGLVRRTPLLPAAPSREHSHHARGLLLKLEALQVTGSFKPRGAINALLGLPSEKVRCGIVTASGGNHGLAVAYAGYATSAPATIFLPRSVSRDKRASIEGWGARSVITGEDWDDSNRAALQFAADEGFVYIHPFADPHVIAGQGTVALEILDDAPDLDTLLVAIGGGGLISGIAIAAKALKPAVRIIGVEPTGAPTLHASLAAGRLVELARLDTAAVTLAPRRSESLNLAIVTQAVGRIVLVEDHEMAAAARWLWREMGVAAELSGAAAVAAILAGRYCPAAGERVCAVVCGAGTDGIDHLHSRSRNIATSGASAGGIG